MRKGCDGGEKNEQNVQTRVWAPQKVLGQLGWGQHTTLKEQIRVQLELGFRIQV